MSTALHTCSFCEHTTRRSTDLSLHTYLTHGIDFRPSIKHSATCVTCGSEIAIDDICRCHQIDPTYRHR
jgi:hypothetical protein